MAVIEGVSSTGQPLPIKTLSDGTLSFSGASSNGAAPYGGGGMPAMDVEAATGAARFLKGDVNGVLMVGSLTPGAVITNSSGNVANASAVATLAGVAAKTTWITGFQICAAGATAGLAVNVTVTGTISGTLNFTFVFPTGATVPATPLMVSFPSAIPASAVNTAIVVTCPAGGAGNTNTTATAQGFQL